MHRFNFNGLLFVFCFFSSSIFKKSLLSFLCTLMKHRHYNDVCERAQTVFCFLFTSLDPPIVVCRCFKPCVIVYTLLYAGSSVLQIAEFPVCSLDTVPQALACDWLLACLQVTFPFSRIHQSTTSSKFLILLIKPTRVDLFISF